MKHQQWAYNPHDSGRQLLESKWVDMWEGGKEERAKGREEGRSADSLSIAY